MKSFPWFQTLLIGILGICLFSCALYKANENRPPPVAVPQDFSQSGHPKTYGDRWWLSFEDPALDGFVEQALADNLGLIQAWARLEQATALARQAAAGHWPEISIETGYSKSQSNFSGGDRLGTFSITTERIPLTIGAAYEVDLWKRIASRKRGALLDREATREDMESIAMTLAAQVAEAWFSLVEQGAQIRLLDEQQKTGQTFLELTRLRFSQGLASALDVYQQRQQLAATRAEVPLVESRREVFRHQLAVLVGDPPLALAPPRARCATESTSSAPDGPPVRPPFQAPRHPIGTPAPCRCRSPRSGSRCGTASRPADRWGDGIRDPGLRRTGEHLRQLDLELVCQHHLARL